MKKLQRYPDVNPVEVGRAVYRICIINFNLYGDLYESYTAWKGQGPEKSAGLCGAVLESLWYLRLASEIEAAEAAAEPNVSGEKH